jgi:hypothetical protein
MSIFGTIISKIFGRANPDSAAVATVDAEPMDASTPVVAVSATPSASPAVTPLSGVDVAARFVVESGQHLDWRVSIVDLMKALGLDSSLDHRKQLAAEFGYTGNTGDSASMNIWLHREVLKALAANGGILPANLSN